VNELIERHHPDLARKEITNAYDGEPADDLLDALEAFRLRQAARLLRDTVGAEDG
jgi:hypothetical protein